MFEGSRYELDAFLLFGAILLDANKTACEPPGQQYVCPSAFPLISWMKVFKYPKRNLSSGGIPC